FADLEAGDVWHRKLLAFISAALEDRPNQVLVLPGESAEQDRGMGALIRGKRPLDRAVKMLRLLESRKLAQARAFSFEASFYITFAFNLDEIRRHYVSSGGGLNFERWEFRDFEERNLGKEPVGQG